MSPAAERRALQAAVLIGGLVPVSAGFGGVFLGARLVGSGGGPALDSHFAYLSGLLLAIGLGFWAMVPRIERQTFPIRILGTLVVVGGLARLWALARFGVPPPPHLLALAMELVVTPVLVGWQGRIARRAR